MHHCAVTFGLRRPFYLGIGLAMKLSAKFHNIYGTLTFDMCVRLQYYSQCFCGHAYNKIGPTSDSQCNTTCYGSQTQICGGNYRLSVYWCKRSYFEFEFSETNIVWKSKKSQNIFIMIACPRIILFMSACPIGKYGINCTNYCHCRSNTIYNQPGCYFNGSCPAGCVDGWTGTTCNTGNTLYTQHCHSNTVFNQTGCYFNGSCPAGCTEVDRSTLLFWFVPVMSKSSLLCCG